MTRRLLICLAGLVALAVVMAVSWSSLVQHGNAAAADILLRLDHRRHASRLNDPILLAIDEDTVRHYGPLPINRAILAEALNRVASAGPTILIVDMLLSERSIPAYDGKLADALGRFPAVVLAAALNAPADSKSIRWLEPIPEFKAQARAVGHVHIEPDPDGVARSLLLTKCNGSERHWALALEAYRSNIKASDPTIESGDSLWIGRQRIPAARFNDRLLWIRYAGPEGTFPRVSLARVLEERAPLSEFAGKTVILGVTALGAGDRIFTPFSNGMGMSGMEIHANILNMLREAVYLSPLKPTAELLSILTIALMVGVAVLWRHGRFLIPVATAGLLLFPLLAYVLFRNGVLVPLASWMVAQVAASSMGFLVNTMFIRERLDAAISGQQDYAFRLQAVAHEIKNPLTAIHASSQLMAETTISNRKKEEIAQRIYAESGRLSGVVSTFLDVERMAAGVLKLEKQDVDLADVSSVACERASLLALKKHIHIERDLKSTKVRADPDLLHFAIYNLVVNAIKFSSEGSRIWVKLRTDAHASRIEVIDQGCGIELAEQKHLCKRFFRARQSGELQPGSGFGLALVKEIITQHGGRVEVMSEPQKGSVFTLILPKEKGAQ